VSFAPGLIFTRCVRKANANEGTFALGRYLRLLGATGVLAAYLQTAGAQDNPQGTQVLPTIVVSPTTIPTPQNEIASSVTVITAADIERNQYRTVPDALSAVPGLNVVQTGGPGGQTSVFIRGTNSNQVKVLIDGVDAGDPSIVNGAFDFAHLLTGDIAQLEVLRGPQSGLYGADAIGGVISITTKKGEGPAKVTAMLEGGSFRTFNQTAGLSGSEGAFNYAFNVLHYRVGSVPVTPLDLLAPGVRRNNDNYDNWTYSTRLGYDITDNLAVNLTGRYINAKHGFTGDDFVNFFPPSPEVLQETQRNHQLFTRGEVVWSLFDNRFKNFFGVNYSNQWTWIMNPNPDSFTPFGSIAPPTTNVGERTKFDWRGEVRVIPGQTLVLGLEDQRDSLRTDSTFTAVGQQFTTNASTGNKAAWAELQSNFYDRFFLVSNIRYDDNDSFGAHTTWRVAPALIVPGTETKLKATYGTGFRAPTLVQLFVNNPSIGQLANPNLQPETSSGFDVGFEQPLLNGRVSFGVTYYQNDVKNLIVGVFPSATKFINENVGRAKMHGTESFVSATVTDQFKVRFDYTTTRTRDETTDLGLLRRPGNKTSVAAVLTPLNELTIAATLVHVSSWVDVNRDTAVFVPRLDAPAYTTFNLAANYIVNKNVTVFARADNLFNEHYQNPVGFLRPGLGVYAGLRVNN
jgi:vitamin B12 transporter